MSSRGLSSLLALIAQIEREISIAEEAGDQVRVTELEVELGALETDLEWYDNLRGYWRDEE